MLHDAIDELYKESEYATVHRQLVRRLRCEAEGCVELASRLLDR